MTSRLSSVYPWERPIPAPIYLFDFRAAPERRETTRFAHPCARGRSSLGYWRDRQESGGVTGDGRRGRRRLTLAV